MNTDYILSMDSISKEYAGNPVLTDVSIAIKPGEIRALLGENGAGKSTLMNILFGMPVIHNTGGFHGEIRVGGEAVRIASPKDAMQLGIGMVHQEFMLIPGFPVYKNIKLNREITVENYASRVLGKQYESLDTVGMQQDSAAAIQKVGMHIDENEIVGQLPVGHMQFLEIAREVDKQDVRLLVFDEPTAVLNESEASTLLETMRRLSAMGIAIIFITHRLQEVMDVCDTVTILRDGQLITSMDVKDADSYKLAELMVGRSVSYSDIKGRVDKFTDADTLLEVRDLWVDMPGEQVKGMNFQVRKGEIFGIGGLAGQGKLGIPNGIMGLYPASGQLLYKGGELPLNNTADILKRGIAFLSEDRKRLGLLLGETIEDNIVFSAMQIHKEFLYDYKIISFKNSKAIHSYANKMIAEFDIRCVDARQKAGSLSGGNQQKVCLAKALALNPELLFVCEPTRGIDIGAKKIVLDKLQQLSWEAGVTVVMISSELTELRSICDRIMIVNNGKMADVLSPYDTDVKFGLAMAGGTVGEADAV